MRPLLLIHRYFGLFAALTILLMSVTGLLLVHRKALGLKDAAVRLPGAGAPPAADAFDLLAAPAGVLAATRQGVFLREGGSWRLVLPADARRLAAIGGELLAFGREGLYSSRDGGRSWTAELEGIEARAAAATPRGLALASGSGIFLRQAGRWRRLDASGKPALNVRELLASEQGLLLASKEGLLLLADDGRLRPAELPLEDSGERVELQKLVMDLHTGDFFGPWFYLFADLTGLALIALSLSGIYIWFRPWFRRNRANSGRRTQLHPEPHILD